MSPLPLDLRVVNGLVSTPGGAIAGDVGVCNGRIVGLYEKGAAPPAEGTIDAEGLRVLPGFVDVHFHCNSFGRPLLDTFNWKIIPDTNTQVAQVRTGELTIMRGIAPAQALPLRSDPNVTIQSADSVSFSYIGLNKGHPLFQDTRVRKALM